MKLALLPAALSVPPLKLKVPVPAPLVTMRRQDGAAVEVDRAGAGWPETPSRNAFGRIGRSRRTPVPETLTVPLVVAVPPQPSPTYICCGVAKRAAG